jgi:hypothetical protein
VERRLATAAGAAIVIAGTLQHFVYGWSGQNALVGLISPVNESVWEHTKAAGFPVVAVGTVEAVLLHDVRRVAWATLVESILGALAIVAVFYAYTGALGTGPVLWLDITSFVLVVAGGQWLHLRVLLSSQIPVPPALVAARSAGPAGPVCGLDCDAPRFARFPAGLNRPLHGRGRPVPASLSSRRAAAGRAGVAAARAYVRKTLAKMSHASSDLAVRLKAM